MFAYQRKPNTLEFKKDKDIDHVLSWKSKEIKFTPLHTTFLNSTKLSGYITGIKFDNSVLVVEKNNHIRKIANIYIVYDLDTYPKNPLNNFAFGATNTVKNNVKEKFLYSGYLMVAGEWSFNNDSARKVTVFGIDNNLSSHADNQKNGFSFLGVRRKTNSCY